LLSKILHTSHPFNQSQIWKVLLHCALAAAQCIVIGPVCLFVCGWVSMWVGLLPR